MFGWFVDGFLWMMLMCSLVVFVGDYYVECF